MILPLLNYALNRMLKRFPHQGDHDRDRPDRDRPDRNRPVSASDSDQNFYRAHRDAEQALRRLAQTN